MEQIIKPQTVNFQELVKTSTFSFDVQTELVKHLTQEFTEIEQQWYIANLYVYMHYHPTDDYPINLENVYKMIGFANKANAKRALKNNFVENEDYKIVSDETVIRKDDGKFAEETIMLNVDTFKNLCMITKTEKGKEIRKYYVKLENIYNKIIKKELEEQQKQLEQERENSQKLLEKQQKQLEQERENTQRLLEEQQKKIEMLETKPETEGFFIESGYIYIIKETSKFGRYKIGKSKNPIERVSGLNVSSSETSLIIDRQFQTIDMDCAEKIIHLILKPYKIKKRSEWFFFKNEIELNNAINTIESCLEFTKQYRNYDNFIDINKQNDKKVDVLEQKNENEISEKEKIGVYKGVFWDKGRNKWRTELVKNYKCYFLGYYNTELDGAKAYNDYASYLNNTEGANFQLNEIEDYIPNPRNIPDDNKNLVLEKKSSKYIGVHYDNTRQHFVASMRFKRKHINLGHHVDEIECAKLYNQQALYFNNNYDTNYTLNDIENYVTIEKNIYDELRHTRIDNKTSAYIGVIKRKNGRYNAQIVLDKKHIRLGIFDNEIDAAKAYNEKAKELNIKYNKNYKLNMGMGLSI